MYLYSLKALKAIFSTIIKNPINLSYTKCKNKAYQYLHVVQAKHHIPVWTSLAKLSNIYVIYVVRKLTDEQKPRISKCIIIWTRLTEQIEMVKRWAMGNTIISNAHHFLFQLFKTILQYSMHHKKTQTIIVAKVI